MRILLEEYSEKACDMAIVGGPNTCRSVSSCPQIPADDRHVAAQSVIPGDDALRGRGNPELACRLVVRLVAARTRIAEALIMAPTRGLSDQARARQIAMYLLHTSLSIPYGDIASFFERDRTTVSHACRTIEDGRDNGALNAMLCELEGILELIGPLAGFQWRSTAG